MELTTSGDNSVGSYRGIAIEERSGFGGGVRGAGKSVFGCSRQCGTRRLVEWRSNMPQLEEVLLSVWRQALVDNAKYIQIGEQRYPVRTTAKRRLKQIDFEFDGRQLRGLEQNPDTKSRWAKMAREGKKVMQFLENHKYVAVVADGEVKTYK